MIYMHRRRELTVQVVGSVERVQTLLAPLHEAVLLALGDRLEQLQQLLLLLRHLLVGAAAHRVTVDRPRRETSMCNEWTVEVHQGIFLLSGGGIQMVFNI